MTGDASKELRTAMLVAVSCLSAGALAVVVRPEAMPASAAILALAIAALGFLPALLFFRLPVEERPVFPLIVLSGAFYGLFFGLSAFAMETLRVPPDGRIFIFGRTSIANIGAETQLLSLAGVATMLGAYGCCRRPALRLPRFRLPQGLDSGRSRLAFWGLLAVHFAYLSVPSLAQIPSLGQFLRPAGYLAFAGLYVLWRRAELRRFEAAALFAALSFECALILKSTSLTPLLLLVTMLLALEFAVTRRLPWIRIVCFALILTALYPAAQTVRQPVWSGTAEGGLVRVPIMLVRSLFGLAPYDTASSAGRRSAAEAPPHPFRGPGLARRVSHIGFMEHVVANTPDRVPYWKGETYIPLLTSSVPRFLWPGKPREETGWAFGVRYGILKVDDPPQSMNLPWMTEMYANFGGPGVILGMGLVGALLAFLEAFLSRPSMTPAEMAAGTAVIVPLFMQDSNFSLMTGSIPLLIVAFWIVLAVAAKIPLPSVLSKDRPGS